MSVLPIGEAAVGVEVAKDFGDDEGGVFQGVVVSAWLQGKRRMYHVEYQEDNASTHQEGRYSSWLQDQFTDTERGWLLRLQAPTLLT